VLNGRPGGTKQCRKPHLKEVETEVS
jgi:hypothetical protein